MKKHDTRQQGGLLPVCRRWMGLNWMFSRRSCTAFAGAAIAQETVDIPC